MRTFQVLCAALGVVAVRSQLITSSRGLSYGTGLGTTIGTTYGSGLSSLGSSYGSLGTSYGTGLSSLGTTYGTGLSSLGTSYGSLVPASVGVTRTISAAPAVSYAAAPIASRVATISAAPAISTISAAPAVSYAAAPIASRVATISAAPAISTISAAPAIGLSAAAPVNVGVIAAGGAPSIRSHEIHTGTGNTAIRIEDHQVGDQVIRVHEGPQEGPQVAQVQVPGEQHHVRVVDHASGRAHVERVVARQPTQVIDVQKPGRPGARIVQVVKGQSPPPAIEFVQDGGSSHEVYYADDVGAGGVIGGGSLGGGIVSGGLIGGGSLGGRIISSGSLGGGVIGGGLIGGGVRTISAAPAITTVARAAPAISYGTSYGSGLGGLSYGTSYGSGLGGISYGSGLNYGTRVIGSGLGYGSGLSYGSGISTLGSGLGVGLGQTTYGIGYGSPAVYSSYAKKAAAAAKAKKSS